MNLKGHRTTAERCDCQTRMIDESRKPNLHQGWGDLHLGAQLPRLACLAQPPLLSPALLSLALLGLVTGVEETDI